MDPDDEVAMGAKLFLEDHDYDFDALHDFLQSGSGRKQMVRRIPLGWWMAAASLAIFCLLAGGWYLRIGFRHQQMTESVFHEPGLPVFASLTQEKEFHEMMSAFRLQDTEEGFRQLESLWSKGAHNDTLSYFGGWFHYMDRDYRNAALHFAEVTAEKGSIYHAKARLMEAGSLLLDGRKDPARQILLQLQEDPQYPYSREAARIMQNSALW